MNKQGVKMAKKIDSLDEIFEEKDCTETYEYNEGEYKLCPTCDGKGYKHYEGDWVKKEYGCEKIKQLCGHCEGAGLLKYQVVAGVGGPQWSRQGLPKRYKG